MSDLQNQVAWYEARDYLFGYNGRSLNVQKALELARTTNHPDAEWLLKIFEGQPIPSTLEELVLFFRRFYDEDADLRAGTFWMALLHYHGTGLEPDTLTSIADRGEHPLAQFIMFLYLTPQIGMVYAKSSADQGEREGFLAMSMLVTSNRESLEYLNKAIALNSGSAMIKKGHIKTHMMKWSGTNTPGNYHEGLKLMERAAAIGCYEGINNSVRLLYSLVAFSVHPELLTHAHTYGHYLSIMKNNSKTEWHPESHSDAEWIISVYHKTNAVARRAITTTIMIFRRLYGNWVPKDIRLVIARRLWKKRRYWVYAIAPKK
jgi:hypothetical protein